MANNRGTESGLTATIKSFLPDERARTKRDLEFLKEIQILNKKQKRAFFIVLTGALILVLVSLSLFVRTANAEMKLSDYEKTFAMLRNDSTVECAKFIAQNSVVEGNEYVLRIPIVPNPSKSGGVVQSGTVIN